MESVTYYLKYRPQKVSELDSAEVRESLEKILKSGKIPHAFLFSGPKGTGKTSAARIVAKVVNCIKKQSFEPCNKCEVCREISAGTALDLIEIDAASNRGIDDIRNLREKIKLSPAKCRYKVYIIDEAHMLTPEAFNALLKTLEEPPAHAIFILCTTAPEKLPKTIISRCTQIKFRKAKPEEVIRSLKRAVKGEKLLLEKGVLEEISTNVDGSFRDGQKILDQLTSAGEKISLSETKKLLGQIEELKPEKLLSFLAEREVKSALLEIDRVVNFGADLESYAHGILESLRCLLLEKVGASIGDKEIPDPKIMKRLDKADVIKLINLFTKAALEIKVSPIPQLPLELAVVEWCEQQIKNEKLKMKNDNEKIENEDTAGQHSSERTASPFSKKKLDKILEKWGDLLAQVRPLNHSVEALLRAARPIRLDGEFLTLEVFYKFHKERLETEKCRVVVEEVASQILKRPIKLKCVLGEKKRPEVSAKPEESDIMDFATQIFNGKIVD